MTHVANQKNCIRWLIDLLFFMCKLGACRAPPQYVTHRSNSHQLNKANVQKCVSCVEKLPVIELQDIIRQYAASKTTGCYHTKQLDLMMLPQFVAGRNKLLCTAALLWRSFIWSEGQVDQILSPKIRLHTAELNSSFHPVALCAPQSEHKIWGLHVRAGCLESVTLTPKPLPGY